MIELTKEKWEQLTHSERNVIQYINEHEEKIPEMSILDLAMESYTSSATVSRAIRKCGINGIAELRYIISTKLEQNSDSTVVNTIFQKFLTECSRTIDNIRISTITKLIHFIKEAERIFVVARGTTALIAEDFVLQLQLLGYHTFLLKDSEILKRTYKLFRQTDLIIIFTIKNSTPELAIAAQNAQSCHAKVVTCCCLPQADIYKYSDLVILGNDQNNQIIEDFAIVSRFSLHIISRTIVEYLMLSHKETESH